MHLLFLAMFLSLFPGTLRAEAPFNRNVPSHPHGVPQTEDPFNLSSTSHPPAAWTARDSSPDLLLGSNATTAPGTFSSFQPILSLPVPDSNGSGRPFPVFSCGFLSNHGADSTQFGLVVYYSTADHVVTGEVQVIWSANGGRPVPENATLDFSEYGNLVLKDADGTVLWSTDTSGLSVATMELTETGCLVLLDDQNATVWTSEAHPTDTWFQGQTLREGQRLTSNASAAATGGATFYLGVVRGGLAAYVDSNPPQLYYQLISPLLKSLNEPTDAMFDDGGLHLVPHVHNGSLTLDVAASSTLQFMRLESDGHLRHYGRVTEGGRWSLLDDVFNLRSSTSSIWYVGDPEITPLEDCSYPTSCGEYGLCSKGECSCPDRTHFKQVNERQLNLGCSPVVPLSCPTTKDHRFLHLTNVSSFNYNDWGAALLRSTDEELCKEACLRNCSCKAAFFKFADDNQNGSCHLTSHLYSVFGNEPDVTGYNSSAYIKVQEEKARFGVAVIVVIILGSFLFASIAIGFIISRIRKKRASWMEKEENLELIAGLPKRYSFDELKVATENFRQKLGGGGFGSVFKGTLDGERVAVKLLEGVGQGIKEFLAEVKTIGSIHHINLVRLIGFCSEKSHKLLVYEYMCNGSLDKWVFSKIKLVSLDWQTRIRIITDVARGLSYLHEECRQRIAHFDIKPQNILLDGEFHAKVSDFGLSKLIDRDLSHVRTTMRGTRGYLAPEWLSSKVTEKADVYSFGVVVMEIICGRKSLDYSQPEECNHLISMLQDKAQTNQLLDLASIHNLGIHLPENEVINMMELALWCLQQDSTRRPSTSTVVQVLEGSLNAETDADYNLTHPTVRNADYLDASPSQSASLLSGPR